MPKSVRAAEAIKANSNKSDRAIAAELGVHNETISRARRELSHDATPDDSERIGRDGKSYSIRQRVTEDPDIPTKLVEAAAATGRQDQRKRCQALARMAYAKMTNQNEYSLTIGMKMKTLTIASIAKMKEVNDAKLIATSPGCSRMARQAVPDDRERGGDHQHKISLNAGCPLNQAWR